MLTEDDRRRLRLAIDDSLSQTPLIDSNGILRERYLNSHKLLAKPDVLRLCSAIMLEFARQANATYLIGLALGGCCLAGAMSALSAGSERPLPVALLRDREKTHGYAGKLNHAISKDERVFLVDDVISTGTSMQRALDFLVQQQMQIAGLAAAIRRGDDGVQELTRQGWSVRTIIDLHDGGR